MNYYLSESFDDIDLSNHIAHLLDTDIILETTFLNIIKAISSNSFLDIVTFTNTKKELVFSISLFKTTQRDSSIEHDFILDFNPDKEKIEHSVKYNQDLSEFKTMQTDILYEINNKHNITILGGTDGLLKTLEIIFNNLKNYFIINKDTFYIYYITSKLKLIPIGDMKYVIINKSN